FRLTDKMLYIARRTIPFRESTTNLPQVAKSFKRRSVGRPFLSCEPNKDSPGHSGLPRCRASEVIRFRHAYPATGPKTPHDGISAPDSVPEQGHHREWLRHLVWQLSPNLRLLYDVPSPFRCAALRRFVGSRSLCPDFDDRRLQLLPTQLPRRDEHQPRLDQQPERSRRHVH